ncbi:ABC transporter A family member 9 [Smittium mucronatum]|uniref:ABC transporter A family member 9 n=1 Tax=Smittium mucronatum TaxID=133383 RepID=A0A1R0GWD7_9FUNG|nr:ABC transporter A family member 9 [Smittium mucronatum]
MDSEYDSTPVERKSFQFRALLRNKLSYQRRQLKINICCVALCPFLMVAIGGIIGIVIKRVIKNSNPRANYLMCSNENVLDDYNLPISGINLDNLPTFDSSQVPKSKSGELYYLTNYYILPYTISDKTGQTRPFSIADPAPSCAWSLDKDYSFSDPYFLNPNVSLSARIEASDKPDPLGGWLNTILLAQDKYALKLFINQGAPWFLVRDSPTGGAGYRNRAQPISIPSTVLYGPGFDSGSTIQDYLSSNSSQSIINSTMGSGILNQATTRFYFNAPMQNVSYPYSFQAVPWFDSMGSNNVTAEDVDDALSNKVKSVLAKIQTLEPNIFNALYANVSDPDDYNSLLYYYGNTSFISTELPWGALVFDKTDNENMVWEYTLQVGENVQTSSAGSILPIVQRMVNQQAELGNSFLKSALNNAEASIVHLLRAMPQIYIYEFSVPIGSLVGTSLYPFGVTFLISIFVLIIVKEKEDRILIMMQMNGLKLKYYYISHYLHFFILAIWSFIFFVISGKVFKLEMFEGTSLGVLCILLLVWANAMISVSFFLSSIFQKSSSSQVIIYLIVLWSVIIDGAISFIYTSSPPLAYLIWPPFAMFRGMSRINAAAVSTERPSYTFSDLKSGDDVFNSIIALIIGWFVYLILAVYLNLVIGGDFGIRRPWHFFITDFFKKEVEIPRTLDSVDESELQFEDSDVKAERNRVLNDQFSHDNPLILRRVRKVYPGGKIAVKDVTMTVEKGTIFGLLGPNGAGKTTIISMMSGLYRMSSGYATLAGFDVTTQTKQVYRNVGICPQHDILWDDLSISEHLYFYARIKGIPAKDEKAVVDDVIERVDLTSMKNVLSKNLSGGQKRRLSIAISFVGNPSVVFLDEPTTGLDPEVRRTVWNIINGNKEGRTIILTTHSMEEAEVLCNRIGIMAQGTMRCIGTQLRLKQLYGSGFLVTISCDRSYLPNAKKFVESMLPIDAQLVDNFVNGASWEFKPQPNLIATLYNQLNANKDHYNINDWGICQTSLDEVFLRIIGEDESGATE